jgi:FkbM family methyltransferase
MFLLDKKDKDTYFREFKNKKKFDYYNSTFDERAKFLIKHFINKGDNVIDVGSHIGLYSLYFSKIVGKNGKVFWFEPQDNIRLKLMRNLTANGLKNFQVFEYCVDKENGTIEFIQVDDKKLPEGTVNSSTTRNEKIDSKYFKDKYNVIIKEKISLDSMFLNIPIKFIKIDTEGNEIAILEGSKNILKKYKPMLLFEFHSKRVNYLKTNLDFIKSNLLKDYECFKIFIDTSLECLTLNKYNFSTLEEYEGDIICFPKDFISSIIKE